MTAIPGKPGITRRRFVVTGLAAAAGVALSNCSGDPSNTGGTDAGAGGAGVSGDPSSGGSGGTLRYHHGTTPPDTLDPARNSVTHGLGYDSLIYRNNEGEHVPRLAESWQYVGEGNTVFEITLREGLTFNDGEPLNAEAVRANIDYRRDPATGAQSAQQLATITEVEIVDERTVRIHLSEPNPLMVDLFSQGGSVAGTMISPAAIASPDGLATQAIGAGPYRLDPNESVIGDHETWIPDPNYWNPDDVHWERIVVHYMPEEAAALAAIQSGQLDAAKVTFASVQVGRDAGLAATGPGHPIVLGISLMDRAGAVTPALGDQRVRQALNYAIDRETIVTALVGDAGQPTDQLTAPGHPGWNEEPFYPYDPGRAEELLAEAGFADGFSFRMRMPQSEEHSRLAQAVADNLSQIGVTMDIHAVPGAQYDQADDATNRDYGAVYLGWGISHPVLQATSFWLPNATNNAFDTADDMLVDLHQQLLVADEATGEDLSRQIIARVAELAWFLPVVLHGESLLYNDGVVQAPWVDFVSVPNVRELRPA